MYAVGSPGTVPNRELSFSNSGANLHAKAMLLFVALLQAPETKEVTSRQ
jgi:hypothetical protein